jgi:hypothetical protein
MGGIAPVRQSDRLVGFTAEARARRYLAPRPARNAVTPLPHIPWRSHPYVRSSSVGLNARIVPLLLPTPQRRVRYFRYWVESRCGAVALGRTYLLPPLSFGGASMVPPWLRFHIPLIEPDRQISRIRLSDKTSRFRVQRHLQLLNIYWS